jgi:DNA-binding MarR family transcriptional regulator
VRNYFKLSWSVISPLSAAHDQAWYRFVLVHARVTAAINARLAQDNNLLPLEHYDVLLCLKRAPGGGQRLRLSELADAVTLSRSGLTRLVDRLEKAGLLRREACSTDRRGAFAVLTPKGAGALRRTWPAYARAIQEYFARHLSDEEADILARAFGRILRSLANPALEAKVAPKQN